MPESVFIKLTQVLSADRVYALSGAFAWGILSVILSPCHLGSIPLIVAFANRQGKISFKRAFSISLIFSVGMLSSITAIGLVTGLTGRLLGDIGSAGFIIVAVIFIVIGLCFAGIIAIPDILHIRPPIFQKRGIVSGFFLGIVFGLALGPCTFSFMAPILGIVFSSASGQFAYSLLLILFYAAGHCIVFVFFGTFSEIAQRYLNWNDKSKGTVIVKKNYRRHYDFVRSLYS
jgi:cytochrome c-type biogenesis protein